MIFEPGSDARRDRLYIHGSKGTISSDVEYNQAGDLSYTVTVDGKKTERKIKAEQNYKLGSDTRRWYRSNAPTAYIARRHIIRTTRYVCLRGSRLRIREIPVIT